MLNYSKKKNPDIINPYHFIPAQTQCTIYLLHAYSWNVEARCVSKYVCSAIVSSCWIMHNGQWRIADIIIKYCSFTQYTAIQHNLPNLNLLSSFLNATYIYFSTFFFLPAFTVISIKVIFFFKIFSFFLEKKIKKMWKVKNIILILF